jgi:hypothetical protein
MNQSSAHPLAYALIDRLNQKRIPGPVIEIGAGKGRNTRALVAAGLDVTPVEDATPYTQLPARSASMAAALSTHAYLHGTSSKLRLGIAELARVLRKGAPVLLTFGSIDDVNYGFGEQIDENTFVPGDGPEKGVPHVYLDRGGVVDLMRGFTIESLEQVDVDAVVGRWAHSESEPPGKRHWFVTASRL